MNYVILGANAAGLSAAVRILKYDAHARITVLEKSDVVSFGSCGIPYYIGGEFTNIDLMTARSLADFIKQGIDLRIFHEVRSVDSDSKTVTAHDISMNQDCTFEYDQLLIAVGASPIIPHIENAGIKNTFTMHSRQDAQQILDALPLVERVVIIGAGFIGVEAAEAFSLKNKQVTLIELGDSVLAKTFDTEMTVLIEETLLKHDINLRLNERVLRLSAEMGCVSAVITDQGAYPADLVIFATGFRPNTQFLQDTGLVFSKEGAIVIDDQCQTNLAHVFAAGDCATVYHRISGTAYIPLATTANKLGRIAGEVMAGQATRFIGTLGSSGIRVFDQEAGRTGITEHEAQALKLDYKTVFIKDKNHTDYVDKQTDMWVKLIYDTQTRQLLGGQVLGAYLGGAVHRVDALAVAIHSQMTVETLGFLDFIYAPPFARTWEILNVAGNVAK